MTTQGVLITTTRLLFTLGYNIFFGICGSIINICTYTYKSILKLSPMKNNYIK